MKKPRVGGARVPVLVIKVDDIANDEYAYRDPDGA